MYSLRIDETQKIEDYGYRIQYDDQGGSCIVYYEDKTVLEISDFNQEAKLRLTLTEKGMMFFVNWVSIKPKKKSKGILVGYNIEGILFGEEIVPEESEPSN